MLISLGYEVETAENGPQALDLLESHSFDLMVTDFKMPGMDGVELIRRARERNPAMSIVLLSAMAEMWGMSEGSTGADAVLNKSGTELSQLTRTIRKLLARKPVRKPPRSAAGSTSDNQKTPSPFMVKSS